jgi:proline racemase
LAGLLTREGNELQGSNACVIRPGKIDRSPTGTGRSARMATLSTRGLMAEGDIYRARSIMGSEFVCRIARRTAIGSRPTIVPIISGRAWITGVSQYMLDPDDPWPSGYRLADTWQRLREAI